MDKHLRWGCAQLAVLTLTAASHAATNYYIKPTGSDALNGRTPANAWVSVSKVATVQIVPGDSILIEAGSTISSPTRLYLGRGDNMPTFDAARPVVITTYPPSGAPATLRITDGGQNGIDLYNVGGVRIRNLALSGPGASASTATGISLYTDLPGTARLSGIRIESCAISGFRNGISVGAWASDSSYSGFDSVLIEQCTAFSNQRAGITSWGMSPGGDTRRSHRNLQLRYCTVYDNAGDPAYTQNHSGNGIVLGDVKGGVVEYCRAYNNGQSNASTHSNGPVGIWVYECSDVCMQYNLSYANKSGNNCDGGGFDIDGGAVRCTLQYNYSYDNVGAGYLICQFDGASAFRDNVVRYNVSENDGGSSGLGGICFYSAGSNGGIVNTLIYGNTVYNSAAAAVKFHNAAGQSGSRLINNIFVTTGGRPLVQNNPGTSVARFLGNSYYAADGNYSIGGATSLSAWQALGQESAGAGRFGIQGNPLLANAGNGEAITSVSARTTLDAYRLLATSPCINAGMNLDSMGIASGGFDYYGGTIPRNGRYDIGAFEWQSATRVGDVLSGVSRRVPAHAYRAQAGFSAAGRRLPLETPQLTERRPLSRVWQTR